MSTESPTDEFEFSETQNVEFRSTAYWMGIAGRAAILLGVLSGLGIISLRVDLLMQGFLTVIAGVWMLNVAKAFRRVAETTGRDVEHLMVAVVNVKKLYRLQVVLMVVWVVVMVVYAVVIMMIGTQALSMF